VAFVEVKRLDVGDPDAPPESWRIRDVIQVAPDAWLRLRPENLRWAPKDGT
jgi:hypothetical protein